MKNLLLILVWCFIYSVMTHSQDLIGMTPDRDVVTDGRDDCVKVNFSIPVPYLRSDCPESNQSDINITYRFKDCFGLILGAFCQFAYSTVELNGVQINTIDYSPSNSVYNENLTSDEYGHLIENTDEVCITIRVFKECTLTGTSEIFSATTCIPVLKEGDSFSRIRHDGPVRQETFECQQNKFLTVCCDDPTVTLSTDIQMELSSSQSNTLNLTFGDFSIGGESIEVDFPTTYSSTTNLTSSWSNGTSILRQLSITPEPGVCKSAALNINFLTEYTDYYSVGGCEEEVMPYISQVTGEVLFNVTFHECILTVCPQERPAIVLSKKPVMSGIKSMCVGSIIADIPSDYEGEIEFSWTGPYGFISTNQNLNDVPYGAYMLTVIDDCCNAYEYNYYLCDDIDYGLWQKQEDDLIFCRVLQCNAGECEVEDSQECVEPDEVVESFENGSCIENYYYNGEFLGQVSSIAEVKIEYNESSKQCIKIAKCNTDELIIEQGSPTYGLWSFDYALEQCHRVIYCFGEEVQTIEDTKVPDIEESFDLITGLCNRTAYCATGVPIVVPPKSPLFSNPWQWSEFQGCTKSVQCSNESGIETINGDEDFTNWTFNSNTDMCESDVTCENTWLPGETHSEFPSSIGTWNWSSDKPLQVQCYRTILCGGSTFVEDTTQPTYQTTGTPCGDGLFEYYIICGGVNTFETGCGSVKSDTDTNEIRSSNLSIQKHTVQIFPNPFIDVIYINGLYDKEKYMSEIRSVSGQIVHKGKVLNNAVETASIPSGIYVLILKQNNKSIFTTRIYKN